jgi:hypothetical protein
MEETEFRYHEEERTTFATKKLKNGYLARIYFYRIEIPIDRFVDIRSIYGVSLAIAKSKKDLNGWVYKNNKHKVNDIAQFKEFGISVLIWAKKMIYKFGKENSQCCVVVDGSNNKRYRVYKRGLKDFKESSYDNQNFLYKIFKWERKVD